jgi:hypothetical protein
MTDPPISTIPPMLRGDTATVTVTDNYPLAQQRVDRLSDAGFPVEHVRIVGSDLHSVEQVTGRRGWGRATATGAGAGAWFGLLIGLLLGLLSPQVFLPLLVAGVVFAALWGAFLGFASHWLTRGRRDFASRQQLVAGQYEVLVSSTHAAEAASLLTGHDAHQPRTPTVPTAPTHTA